jgi:hypothetical protein
VECEQGQYKKVAISMLRGTAIFEAASTLADQRASVEALDRRQLDLWLLTQLGAESQL